MIKVYASGGARSRRVLWALEEAGAPYEVVTLQFPPRVHHPEYLKINPTGAIPAITDGDMTLTESLAICEYVARKHGSDLIVMPDHPDYYNYLQLMYFGEATLAPPLGWARRFASHPTGVSDAREKFGERLEFLEVALADGREYLVAGRLTLADISVGYTLGLSELFGLHDLIPPAIVAYEDRLKARPAYQRAYSA